MRQARWQKTALESGSVETWYDRISRNWVTQTLDADRNQIDDATYCYRREQAKVAHAYHVEQARKEYEANLPLIGDQITLKDGRRVTLSEYPETRPGRRKIGWCVTYNHNGISVTDVIHLDDIDVNHSRPGRTGGAR